MSRFLTGRKPIYPMMLKEGKYRAKRVFFCLDCQLQSPKEKGRLCLCGHCGKPCQNFDSTMEFKRYQELHMFQTCKEISDLELQVAFPVRINDVLVCTYYCDFRYKDKQGKVIVEDVKGMLTPVYRLKKKLVKAVLGVNIFET